MSTGTETRDPVVTTAPETAPLTWPQIRARLQEIAPFRTDGTGPVEPEELARSIALSAQRRWTRNLSSYFDGKPDLFSESVAAVCAEFASLHLLTALIGLGKRTPGNARPAIEEIAGELATQIRDAWDDGGRIGEWLYEYAQALGIDTDEVDALEEAWQALPEVQAARERQ